MTAPARGRLNHRPSRRPLAAWASAALAGVAAATWGCDRAPACPDGICPAPLTCVDGACVRLLFESADGGSTGSDAEAACPDAAPPAARAAAATAATAGGIAALGGYASSCGVAAPLALSDAVVVHPCGHAAPLPPLPDARLGAAAALHPVRGELWLVGGRSGEPGTLPRGDVLRLDAAAGWVAAAPPVSPRSHGAFVATASPAALWLFGGDIGYGGAPVATGELRRLRGEEAAFAVIVAGGAPPGPRRGAAVAAATSGFALFGGFDAAGARRSDLRWFDAATAEWHERAPGPHGPTARDGAMLAPMADGWLLFGGEDDQRGLRNDLWRWRTDEGWLRIGGGDRAPDGSFDGPLAAPVEVCAPPLGSLIVAAATPQARRDAAWVARGAGEWLLYGGVGRCAALGDVWRFDGNTWYLKELSNGGLCGQPSCAHLCDAAGRD